jgi:hyperosmotically inducible protein
MKNVLATSLTIALAIGGAAPLFAADAPPAAGADDASVQPGTDAWITTKVKTELMTTSGVPSTDIKVTTNNGVVTLTGQVDSKAQVDKAIAVAKAVKGVHNVDAAALSSRNR